MATETGLDPAARVMQLRITALWIVLVAALLREGALELDEQGGDSDQCQPDRQDFCPCPSLCWPWNIVFIIHGLYSLDGR